MRLSAADQREDRQGIAFDQDAIGLDVAAADEQHPDLRFVDVEGAQHVGDGGALGDVTFGDGTSRTI
jgi:hypothetical protein